MDVPTHPEPLIITDAAVNIAPTLEEKVDIVQNAIDLAHALGAEEVRVAILSAMEEHDAELALKACGQIEGIYTASYLMQPRSLALLVEQEIQ